MIVSDWSGVDTSIATVWPIVSLSYLISYQNLTLYGSSGPLMKAMLGYLLTDEAQVRWGHITDSGSPMCLEVRQYVHRNAAKNTNLCPKILDVAGMQPKRLMRDSTPGSMGDSGIHHHQGDPNLNTRTHFESLPLVTVPNNPEAMGSGLVPI